MPKPINFITFPRSGHHFLMDCFILAYEAKHGLEKSHFPDSKQISDRPTYQKGELTYCEFYKHCRKSPCSSGHIFQKNHDFDLDFEPPKDNIVVVQLRHPAYSFSSFQEMDWRQGIQIPLPQHVRMKMPYWSRFVDKWRDRGDCVIKYEDLVADPRKFVEVIAALSDLEVDISAVPEKGEIKRRKVSKKLARVCLKYLSEQMKSLNYQLTPCGQ